MKYGFDNDKYLKLQSENILKRIEKFDNKLYLEFGGKLFDDFHASRVLPGFKYDIKIELLKTLKEQTEVIFCISANDIQKNKMRADYGITYDMDVMRLIDNLRRQGIEVNSVVITQYNGQAAADTFKNKLDRRNITTYIHQLTKGYPTDIDIIVSDEGYGVNPYIKTTKPLVVVTAPGASSGKLATCLSQLYHEHKRGIKAGYAKFETFPIWNLPLKHPVNLAYEAATADIKDTNMIDSFHLETYNVTAVNYNRDLQVFPILNEILNRITGYDVYKSPTDMGVNMVGFCITDDKIVREAANAEIIRRYFKSLCDYKQGRVDEDTPKRIKVLMNELGLKTTDRKVVEKALLKMSETNKPVLAIELADGHIITGKNTEIMTCAASAVINAIKYLTGIDDNIKLLAPEVLEPMLKLKTKLFDNGAALLNLQDVLLGLSICSATNDILITAINNLDKLHNLEAHASFFLNPTDEQMLRCLKINFTSEAEFYSKNLYINE